MWSGLLKGALVIGAAVFVYSCVQETRDDQAKRKAEAAAYAAKAAERQRRRQEEVAAECLRLDEALALLSADDRNRLEATIDKPRDTRDRCLQILYGDCPAVSTATILFEQIGRRDVLDLLTRPAFLDEECAESIAFGRRYGLDAMTEHLRLLETAVEAALARRRD